MGVQFAPTVWPVRSVDFESEMSVRAKQQVHCANATGNSHSYSKG